jgi:hypothetical protein
MSQHLINHWSENISFLRDPIQRILFISLMNDPHELVSGGPGLRQQYNPEDAYRHRDHCGTDAEEGPDDECYECNPQVGGSLIVD